MVCVGLLGVSLAPGICLKFNFMQMEVGRKCCDAGTCKPRQGAGKAGGKLHLRLNTGTRPIVNKYRKGKLKRTLHTQLDEGPETP